ncbi:MAG: hypothetical protein J7513_16060 [Solirubrobacteraceae bacterium]|nr:hypothetical protein [Solirubrobacteraceae bacterium]
MPEPQPAGTGNAIELRTEPVRRIDVFPDLHRTLMVLFMALLVTTDSWPGDAMRLAMLVLSVLAGGAYWRRNLRSRSVLQVNADGLWPRGHAFIPAERFRSIAIRRWAYDRLPTVPMWFGLTVVLDDDREVCVPSVTRSAGEGARSLANLVGRVLMGLPRPWEGSATESTILIRRWTGTGWSEWSALTDGGGEALLWTPEQDGVVQARLDEEIRRALGPATGDRAVRSLGNLVGIRSGTGKAMWAFLITATDRYVYTPIKPAPAAPAPADAERDHPKAA